MDDKKNPKGAGRKRKDPKDIRKNLVCRVHPDTFLRLIELKIETGLSKGELVDKAFKDFNG